MAVYLFGYLEDDFYGRVIVTSEDAPVGDLAAQLAAWSVKPDRCDIEAVTDEGGTVLDPALTVAQAGLGNGHIFKVRRA